MTEEAMTAREGAGVRLQVRTTRSFRLHLPTLWLSLYRIHRKHEPMLRAAARATSMIGNQVRGRRLLLARWHHREEPRP